MSKGTKSLRQKAKILGRFRGFSKQGSGDQGSEDGSGISDGTAKSAQKNQLASPPSMSQNTSPGASRKSSINPGKILVYLCLF